MPEAIRSSQVTSETKIIDTFWTELGAHPVVMLGLSEAREGHAQPMTAYFDGKHGPIWFFAGKDDQLWQLTGAQTNAVAHYVAEKHGLFASVHGQLFRDDDRDVIDHFWSPGVAAWYPGGKDDPNLALMRFEPDQAKIWLAEMGFRAAISALFKGAPEAMRDNVAQVRL
jgi:general stress protein 26